MYLGEIFRGTILKSLRLRTHFLRIVYNSKPSTSTQVSSIYTLSISRWRRDRQECWNEWVFDGKWRG